MEVCSPELVRFDSEELTQLQDPNPARDLLLLEEVNEISESVPAEQTREEETARGEAGCWEVGRAEAEEEPIALMQQ
jgi:hypothetical protein